MAEFTQIPEIVDSEHRLGRHISRPEGFAMRTPATAPPKTTKWVRHTPAFNQGNLGSCHDADTEILTKSGWLPFPDLTRDNELATVDPATGTLIFEKPVRVIELDYEGDVYHGMHQSLDFVVTPDHQMLVRKWSEPERTLAEEYSLIAMKDVGWYAGLMNSVTYSGSRSVHTYTLPAVNNLKRKVQREDKIVSMEAWLNFLGIYLAEGTMLGTDRDRHKIQLAASKDREKSFIRKTLSALDLHYTELTDRFTFSNQQIYEHLIDLGLKGVYASEKFVPRFVFNLPGDQIKHLLVGHREGDGSLQDGAWSHYTSSPQLADDIQILLFLSGTPSGKYARAPRTSTMSDGRQITGRHSEISIRARTTTFSSINRKANVTVEHYSGKVYCAEVPTYHTLVTRRNGKILISGNCTGNAAAGALMTEPFYHVGRNLTEVDAVSFYSKATTFDDFPAVYPPTDCGSSGPGVAKAVASLGYISSYSHVTDLNSALGALTMAPGIFGVAWMDTFDNPDASGEAKMTSSSQVRGGHEIQAFGLDMEQRQIWFYQSWGPTWGPLGNGTFWMSFDTLDAQLSGMQSDGTFFQLAPDFHPTV